MRIRFVGTFSTSKHWPLGLTSPTSSYQRDGTNKFGRSTPPVCDLHVLAQPHEQISSCFTSNKRKLVIDATVLAHSIQSRKWMITRLSRRFSRRFSIRRLSPSLLSNIGQMAHQLTRGESTPPAADSRGRHGWFCLPLVETNNSKTWNILEHRHHVNADCNVFDFPMGRCCRLACWFRNPKVFWAL